MEGRQLITGELSVYKNEDDEGTGGTDCVRSPHRKDQLASGTTANPVNGDAGYTIWRERGYCGNIDNGPSLRRQGC